MSDESLPKPLAPPEPPESLAPPELPKEEPLVIPAKEMITRIAKGREVNGIRMVLLKFEHKPTGVVAEGEGENYQQAYTKVHADFLEKVKRVLAERTAVAAKSTAQPGGASGRKH